MPTSPHPSSPCTQAKSQRKLSSLGAATPSNTHADDRDRDMGNIATSWDIEGVITPQQSVSDMLNVIGDRRLEDSGTFWTWEGKVS